MASASSRHGMKTIEVQDLSVQVVRKPVKNLNLRVKRDGTVVVSASPRVSMAQIETFVAQKHDWIVQARQRVIQKNQTNQTTCVEGASLRYWGELLHCHLELQASQAVRSSYAFRVEEDHLIVTCSEPPALEETTRQTSRDRALSTYLTKTFRQQALAVLPSCEALVGKSCSKLRIRSMTSRWGSCNVQTAAITLNSDLIHYPEACLRYVIIHELCHLYEPHHNEHFHSLMDQFCPDWRSVRALLNAR